jgi:hypothetical protein
MAPQPAPAEAPAQAVVLRERANSLLREAVDATNADLWGNTIRHAMVDAAMVLHTEAAQLEGPPLEPHDVASWAAFLPTVRVGGALPVTFRPDGDHVVTKVVVPYVPSESESAADSSETTRKIPIKIAEGFPVPLTGRHRLPRYSPDTATRFLRQIVRAIYQHEIDEQLRVGDERPFAPEH